MIITAKEEIETYKLGYGGTELKDVLEYVSSLIEHYGPKAELELEVLEEYGSPVLEANIKFKREQTEQEQRVSAALEEARKEHRRKQFEALKKEFDGSSNE